jgi:predicted DCC family thiol-disulfide oxidoreductase YuxK
LSKYLLAYDADCGPCAKFKRVVQILDMYNRIDFLSLLEAEKLGFLNEIPQDLRHSSFHLISPVGETWSGAEALPCLIDLFPLGHPISKLILLLPAGKRITKFIYSTLSKLRDSSSCGLHH